MRCEVISSHPCIAPLCAAVFVMGVACIRKYAGCLIITTPPHRRAAATLWRAPLRRMSGPADVDAAAHAAFLADRAHVTPCRHLPALLSLLRLQGLEVVAPAERRAMHPHVVPLARDPSSGQVTSLLRLPFASKGDMLPLVRSTGAAALTLVAPGAQQYLHRCGVEADEEGDGALRDATLACVNASGQIYQKGDFAKHTPKLPLEKYIAVKVGVFPDVYEAIANSHMERGDATVLNALSMKNSYLSLHKYKKNVFLFML